MQSVCDVFLQKTISNFKFDLIWLVGSSAISKQHEYICHISYPFLSKLVLTNVADRDATCFASPNQISTPKMSRKGSSKKDIVKFQGGTGCKLLKISRQMKLKKMPPYGRGLSKYRKTLTSLMDVPQVDYLELLASDVLMDSYRPCNNLKKI